MDASQLLPLEAIILIDVFKPGSVTVVTDLAPEIDEDSLPQEVQEMAEWVTSTCFSMN